MILKCILLNPSYNKDHLFVFVKKDSSIFLNKIFLFFKALLAVLLIDLSLTQSDVFNAQNKSVSGKHEPIIVAGGRGLNSSKLFMVSLFLLSACVTDKRVAQHGQK